MQYYTSMTKLYLCFIITGYSFSSSSSGLTYIPHLLLIFLAFVAFSVSTGSTRSLRVSFNISTETSALYAFTAVPCRKASPSSLSKIYHKLLSHNNRARELKHLHKLDPKLFFFTTDHPSKTIACISHIIFYPQGGIPKLTIPTYVRASVEDH